MQGFTTNGRDKGVITDPPPPKKKKKWTPLSWKLVSTKQVNFYPLNDLGEGGSFSPKI